MSNFLPADFDYALVFNAVSNGMAITDQQSGTILDVNQAWIAATGIPREAAIGKSAFELGLWCSAEERSACLLAFERSGRLVEFETRLQIKSQAEPYLLSAQCFKSGERSQVLWEFRDIKLRKRNEDALRASEQGLSTILDNVDAYIYLKDTEGRYLFANRAVRQLWNVSMQDILGQADETFFDEATARQIRHNDQRVLQQGETVRAEETNTVPATGLTATYLSTKIPLRREDGSIYALCGISTDITERYQATKALRASEQRLRTIIETEPECIKVIDSRGQLIEMNQAGLAMLEADTLAEAQQQPLGQYLLPKYRKSFLLLHKRVMQGEKGALIFEIRGLKGTRRWLETHAAPLRDGQEQIIGLLGVTSDITERRAAQLKLQQSETLLRSTLESTDEGVLMIGEDGRILSVNKRFLEIWRIPQAIADTGRDELMLAHVLEQLVSPDAFLNLVKALYDSDREARDLLNFKDGRVFSRYTRALMIGEQRGRIWCFKDITEQAQAQAALTESHAFLEAVINATPTRIFWKNRALQYMGCNSVFARDAGKSSPAEIIGKEDDQLSWAEQAELYRADDRAVMASGIAKLSFDEPQTTPSGRTIWLRTSKVPLRNNLNEIIGILGTYEDITERKIAQQALIESESRFREIFNNVSDAIFIHDADTGRIVDVNRRMCEMYGCSYEEALACTPDELSVGIPPYSSVETIQIIQKAFTQGAQKFEWLARRLNGQTFWTEVNLSVAVIGSHRRILAVVHDITERIQAENVLKKRESYQRALLDNFPFLVWLKDEQGRFLAVNQVFAESVGLSSAREMVGKTDLDIWPRDLAESYQADDRTVLQSGHIKHIEEPMETGGERRWIETFKSPIWVEGVVTGTVGFARDITQRKRTEATLLESERMLNESQTIANLGSYVLDIGSGCWECSAIFKQIFGLSDDHPRTVAGWLLLVHPDDRDSMQAYFTDEVIGKKQHFDKVYRIIRQTDLSVRWVYGLGHLKFDALGVPFQMHGTIQDITQRKQTEDQLRQLAQALEQSPESIVITNLDAAIEYVNEAFVRNTGYLREEVIGQNPRFLHSGNTPKATYDALWQAMTQGRLWQGEFYNRRKDGSEFIEFAIITPIRQPDGQISHFVAIKEDITEKKRLAAELEQHRHHLEALVEQRTRDLAIARDEALAASLAKSEFLANMSHEIRTPLNAVLGMAKIGLRDYAQEAASFQFQHIQSSGQHLLGIINDILDFSKIEANRLQVESHRFQLARVVEEVVSLMAQLAGDKGLVLSLQMADDLPAWVASDALRLRQILVNLLSNAIKFTHQGVVSLAVVRQADDTLFQITDTGIGMNEAQMALLFQPFQQADSSTTRQYGGTGLGLAISRRLAQMMGGDIAVQSVAGQGSTFTLNLPLTAVAAPTDTTDCPPQLASEQRLAGLRILATEDIEVNRLILNDILQNEGAQVLFAENGQQAVDRVENAGADAFDVVLMDIQMPVMDGHQATRLIRALRPALPVIGLTAYALAEERAKCLASGMIDHVTKPVDTDVLVNAILCCLGYRIVRTEDARVSPDYDFVAGVNWPALIARFKGRVDFVKKLALTVIKTHTATAGQLRSLVEQRDFAGLAFLAHNIKGLAGNLLVSRMQQRAAETEAAAKQNSAQAFEYGLKLAGKMDSLIAELTIFVGENHDA